MTLDEAIKHCEEVAEQNETSAITYKNCKEIKANMYEKLTAEKAENDCRECAAEHRQLAEWLTELKEAKRLLKAAVEDFKVIGKALDADCDILINCEECPLQSGHYNCRSWNHQDEALALIGEDTNVPASADDTNVGGKIDSWIRCKDKMPEDNTSVLFVYVSENGIKSVHYGYHQTLKGLGSSWAKPSGGWQYCDDDVTHWQPLPEPPKE